MNILKKSGAAVLVLDLDPMPVARLVNAGAIAMNSIAELAAGADIVMLSLPTGAHVEACLLGEAGALAHAKTDGVIVDLSTSSVPLTRKLADEVVRLGVGFADAPVARTRQAAIDGTLSITVGASDATFERIQPVLRCAASDVTHCGAPGAGQVVKILNNMVLFETVVALSEAMALGTAAGVDAALLFDALSKGSADSFALRNHGMKAMLPKLFPKAAFPTAYALKDVSYALELAEFAGYRALGAELAKSRLEKAMAAGFSEEYFPVFAQLVDRLPEETAVAR
jgi:3-hydroxyisobutyrate dehydrogenase-like beta-hydroxyacid dehydrogenase